VFKDKEEIRLKLRRGQAHRRATKLKQLLSRFSLQRTKFSALNSKQNKFLIAQTIMLSKSQIL